MPRDLTSAMLAAITDPSVRPAFFLYTEAFSSGPVRVWTGWGTITWGGNTWQGIGDLGTISTIEEGTDIEARGLTVQMTGFDTSILGKVLDEFQKQKDCYLYVGFFDTSNNLIADPAVAFAGSMDDPRCAADAKQAILTINIESPLLDMNVGVERRYTHTDQQIDYPGDMGFEFVDAIQERTIYWGEQANSTNNH